MSLSSIREALSRDGYDRATVERADEIRHAAAVGCLLWTSARLTTTDRSRIDARPYASRKRD